MNPHRELPFKKGDILDLTHTVDDNWLKGMLDGRKGIFPKSYVKVSVCVGVGVPCVWVWICMCGCAMCVREPAVCASTWRVLLIPLVWNFPGFTGVDT